MIYSLVITCNILVLISKTNISDYMIMLTLIVMCIAAIFIVNGFVFLRKGLRLYGLILLILSVTKMIIADVSGSSSIIRVLALLIGGVICLAISFLYNKLEKKLESKNKNEIDIYPD